MGKIRKEPIWCLKCQGWNHFAYECIASTDKCANCAEEHCTDQCLHSHRHKCVLCNAEGHASWSRSCLVFIRKQEECDHRNPENNLQFILSSEPWSWMAHEERPPHSKADSYRPNYGDPPSRNFGEERPVYGTTDSHLTGPGTLVKAETPTRGNRDTEDMTPTDHHTTRKTTPRLVASGVNPSQAGTNL